MYSWYGSRLVPSNWGSRVVWSRVNVVLQCDVEGGIGACTDRPCRPSCFVLHHSRRSCFVRFNFHERSYAYLLCLAECETLCSHHILVFEPAFFDCGPMPCCTVSVKRVSRQTLKTNLLKAQRASGRLVAAHSVNWNALNLLPGQAAAYAILIA